MIINSNAMFLWQLVILSCVYQTDCVLQNVAIGKLAYQPDRFYAFSYASKAVDGSTNQDMYCMSCTHTKQRTNAWWDVDLGQAFSIRAVKIFNRMDGSSHRLRDVELYIGYSSRSNYRFIQSKSGQVGSSHVFNLYPDQLGRWVKITRRRNVDYEYLQLCEVQVFADVGPDYFKGIKNVALGKTAYQSDNYYKHSYAQKAIDGNTIQSMEMGSCSLTKQTVNAWWDVDLGKTYKIYSVRVINHNDAWAFKLKDVYVYIGQSRNNYKFKGFHRGQINNNYIFRPAVPALGQWVKVTRTRGIDYKELPICEVRVTGEEPPIKYNVHYELIEGHVGTGTILQTKVAATRNMCAHKCRIQLNNGCIAFNYIPGTQQCELLKTFFSNAEVTDSKLYYRMIYV